MSLRLLDVKSFSPGSGCSLATSRALMLFVDVVCDEMWDKLTRLMIVSRKNDSQLPLGKIRNRGFLLGILVGHRGWVRVLAWTSRQENSVEELGRRSCTRLDIATAFVYSLGHRSSTRIRQEISAVVTRADFINASQHQRMTSRRCVFCAGRASCHRRAHVNGLWHFPCEMCDATLHGPTLRCHRRNDKRRCVCELCTVSVYLVA